MLQDKDYAYASISSSAMLVDVGISVWTGRKLDKQVSAEIDQAKSTKTKAGNYHKNLLAGSEKLAEIGKIASAVRNWHYTQTSPWSDAGSRLLPATLFIDYKLKLTEYEKMFSDAVDKFLSEYDTLVTQSAFTLGALFNRDDYPSVDEIKRKFAFTYTFSPVPEVGDFRVDVGNQGMQELRTNFETAINSRIKTAIDDMRTQLLEQLSHMSEKLSDLDEPRVLKDGTVVSTQIFRDSLIDNAVDLVKNFKHLNIMQDPDIETMRSELERAIKNIDAQQLREDDSLRRQTKARVDSLLDKFAL
jgi:hypothetical protein